MTRAIQTIGTTGIANPVTTRKIAMMIVSPLLASPQLDCKAPRYSIMVTSLKLLHDILSIVKSSLLPNLVKHVEGEAVNETV